MHRIVLAAAFSFGLIANTPGIAHAPAPQPCREGQDSAEGRLFYYSLGRCFTEKWDDPDWVELDFNPNHSDESREDIQKKVGTKGHPAHNRNKWMLPLDVWFVWDHAG